MKQNNKMEELIRTAVNGTRIKGEKKLAPSHSATLPHRLRVSLPAPDLSAGVPTGWILAAIIGRRVPMHTRALILHFRCDVQCRHAPFFCGVQVGQVKLIYDWYVLVNW
jgi:hypothetical protein